MNRTIEANPDLDDPTLATIRKARSAVVIALWAIDAELVGKPDSEALRRCRRDFYRASRAFEDVTTSFGFTTLGLLRNLVSNPDARRFSS